MSKEATDRYSVKVEIPITVLLETIFSDDNYDVETLCRWVFHYGFIDLDKKEEVYRLQKDYNEQDFYIWLSKEERKQYDYESTLLNRIEKAIEHLHKRNEQNNSALTNKEETIISKHELLKLENINNKILEDILRGENNE